MTKKLRLGVLTLDPTARGGVFSLARYIISLARKQDIEPTLIFNRIEALRDRSEPFKLSRIFSLKKATIIEESVDGIPCWGVPRILPEFEFFNYLLNRKLWEQAIASADYIFVVGGNNHSALPLALAGKPFAIWMATTFAEDRKDRVRSLPVLWQIREWLAYPILCWLEALVFRKASKIIAISSHTQHSIIRQHGVPAEKTALALMPIDTKKFKPTNRRSAEKRTLVFTGRFSDPRKNIELLLRSFAVLSEEFSDLELLLIGDKLRSPDSLLVTQLQIESKIRILPFLENHDDLISYLQQAFLFVISSHQEGLCISGMEALSCGLPVVSTRCGGPEDFVIDGITGFLAENNNQDSLTNAIRRYLNLSANNLEQMRIKAREFAVENFDADKIDPILLSGFLPINAAKIDVNFDPKSRQVANH